MSLSKTLYQLQQIDSDLDIASKRIEAIDAILKDNNELNLAIKNQTALKSILDEKIKALRVAEHNVEDQNNKISQNQNKLYGGSITNPKELEDLQLEYDSLQKYLSILEDRQLEAMLEMEQAQKDFNNISSHVDDLSQIKDEERKKLLSEKSDLEKRISQLCTNRTRFIDSSPIPDLPIYEKIRKEAGGIAVTLLVDSSCSSCGANIPSAIEQEARSPSKLAYCPACKRILYPELR